MRSCVTHSTPKIGQRSKNGFVVCERLGTASFAEMYYKIYSRDLPVFISADSILHAWHRSYDAILRTLEPKSERIHENVQRNRFFFGIECVR